MEIIQEVSYGSKMCMHKIFTRSSKTLKELEARNTGVAIKSVGERVTSIERRHRSMATSFISLVQSTAATNGSL